MQPSDPQPPRSRRPWLAALASITPLSIALKVLGVIVLGAIAAAISVQQPLGQLFGETSSDSPASPTDATAIATARARTIAEMKGKFQVAEIAGKSPEEVEKVLGKPIFSSPVSPSLAPCPCEQKNYKYGLVEIIYIRGKSDWITINLPKDKVNTVGPYMATQVFKNPDFVSIKVATN
jgi:hypothetical protein